MIPSSEQVLKIKVVVMVVGKHAPYRIQAYFIYTRLHQTNMITSIFNSLYHTEPLQYFHMFCRNVLVLSIRAQKKELIYGNYLPGFQVSSPFDPASSLLFL